MKRWTGWIVAGVLALVAGAALVTHPWSESEIPTASEYSAASDLARDLNEQGLGCDDPTQTRLYKAAEDYFAIFMERRFIPDILVCSVDGRPVVLIVYGPASLKDLFGAATLEDAVDHVDDSVIEDLGIDAMLFGPNWWVMARRERDSIPALSAIRDEVGGTLLVAASPTPAASSSSPTPQGLSAEHPRSALRSDTGSRPYSPRSRQRGSQLAKSVPAPARTRCLRSAS